MQPDETGSLLLIDPFSVVAVTQLLLSVGIIFYLRKLKEPSTATRMLISSFTAFSIMVVFMFCFSSFEYSVSMWSLPFQYICAAIGFHFKIRFAYNFPYSIESYSREEKIVRRFTFSTIVISFLLLIHYISSLLSGLPQPAPYLIVVSILNVTLPTWALVIFLRRTISFDRRKYKGTISRNLIDILLKPFTREAKSCRAFSLLFLLTTPPALLILLIAMGTGHLQQDGYGGQYSYSAVLFCFYHHIPELRFDTNQLFDQTGGRVPGHGSLFHGNSGLSCAAGLE